jgi:prepilin-type N-terminal cleavage/methylation domain-containing protein
MCKSSRAGFTLIELIITIAIMSILLGIATGRFQGLLDTVKATVCEYNLKALNKEYQLYLTENELNNNIGNPHTNFISSHDIGSSGGCPSGGVIAYIDNTFSCSIHNHIDPEEDDDSDNGEVPYL